MDGMIGFIAVDGSVVSGFSFTSKEVNEFHVFLRDMLVSFINEGIFNVIDMGLDVEMFSIQLQRGDGVAFLVPSQRMLARASAMAASEKSCAISPPILRFNEKNGIFLPLVIPGKSFGQLSAMANFLTSDHFLGMVVAEHDARSTII